MDPYSCFQSILPRQASLAQTRLALNQAGTPTAILSGKTAPCSSNGSGFDRTLVHTAPQPTRVPLQLKSKPPVSNWTLSTRRSLLKIRQTGSNGSPARVVNSFSNGSGTESRLLIPLLRAMTSVRPKLRQQPRLFLCIFINTPILALAGQKQLHPSDQAPHLPLPFRPMGYPPGNIFSLTRVLTAAVLTSTRIQLSFFGVLPSRR